MALTPIVGAALVSYYETPRTALEAKCS